MCGFRLLKKARNRNKSPRQKKQRTRVSRGTRKPAAATATASTSSGRQAAFWLDDEDKAIFREVSMNLYSQGIKPSDNLVLRAALRLMPRDHRLIEQIRIRLENDGRKLRHRRE
jgi:hypothetical protein